MTKSAKWLIGIFGFIAAFFIVIILSVAIFFSDDETEEFSSGSAGTIAVVELKEPIMSSERVVREIQRFRENQSVRAIVLRIESPGGGVSASQEIYEEVKKTREYGKPIVVSIGSVAASGGYYAAVGANRIVANPGSITGSIGVISQFMHVDDLLGKIGVTSTTVKSGALKDAGSPFRKPTAADKKYFQEMVDDIHDQFISTVAEERRLKKSVVSAIADGRVFTGKKAYELKLIDTLGTYQDAIKIAAELAEIYGKPRVIKERKRERLSDLIFGEVRSELSRIAHEVFTPPMIEYRYYHQQ